MSEREKDSEDELDEQEAVLDEFYATTSLDEPPADFMKRTRAEFAEED